MKLHLFTCLKIIIPVLKSGGAAPFIEALPLVFGLDAAAATAGDHSHDRFLLLHISVRATHFWLPHTVSCMTRLYLIPRGNPRIQSVHIYQLTLNLARYWHGIKCFSVHRISGVHCSNCLGRGCRI